MNFSLQLKWAFSMLSLFLFMGLSAQNHEIWGVSSTNGDYSGGYIFKTDSAGQNFTTVYSFKKNAGSSPYGSLCYAGNSVYYGMTYQSGANNGGTLFKYNVMNNTYTVVHHFENTTGRNPQGSPFFASNGKIYGLTTYGGTSNKGVLFEYDPSSNAYQVLENFTGTANGANPVSSLIEFSDGRLLGMTRQGGLYSQGSLFEYNISTDSLIKYVDFQNSSTGGYPSGNLMKASNGLLYGLCQQGGANSNGTMFSFNISNGSITKKHDFQSGTTGLYPYGTLTEYNSKLYGITAYGGSNSNGTVFTYDIQSDSLYKLDDFTAATTGKISYGSLTLNNGKFYGMAYQGGSNNRGTIFEFNPTTNTLSNKYEFSNAPGGYYPRGSFVIDSAGIAYALTYGGGAASAGTLFQYNTSTDSVKKLVDFNNGPSGTSPYANLIQASDGKIYGTTAAGGSAGYGVFYSFDPSTHQYAVIKDLKTSTDGKYPNGSIIEASDGNLYGTIQSGGTNSYGLMYRYNPNNQTYATVINFDNIRGRMPMGSIAEGANGIIYGAAYQGGLNGYGALYSYTISSGTFTRLYSFYTDGYYPQTGVIVGNNGKVYGTTIYGGVGNGGVLFEYNPQTTAYSKINTPSNVGRLMQASNGKIYGTATTGGSNYGYILEYNPDSATYSYKFNFTTTGNGIKPFGALLESTSNILIGVTNIGGNNSQGVIYQYDLSNNTYSVLEHLTNGLGFSNASALLGASVSSQITQTINATSCDSYVSPSGKYIWNQSGVYTDTLQATSGVDSILTINLVINAAPTVSFGTTLSSSYCASDAAVSITASPSGGSFSGSGITANIFSPSAANTGSNLIRYTYTDSAGCTSADSMIVQVNAAPTVSFGTTLGSSYCAGDAAVSLTASPSGGSFSGSGVLGTTFNPTNASIGPNLIQYSYTDGNGCSASDSMVVQVNAAPTVSFGTTLGSSYCASDAAVSLTASPSGGSFSGSGIIGNTFNPANANIGSNLIQYSYTDANGCSASDSMVVQVNAAVSVSISSTVDTLVCSMDNPINLTATPAGGSFSGNGVNANTFDAAYSGLGTHTIVYSYTDANSCSASDSIDIQVVANPVATFSSTVSKDYCQNADSVLMQATPSGGYFAGTGVSNNYFHPSVASLGVNSMYYIYSDSNGCAAQYSFIYMKVLETPSVQITSALDSSYCANESPINLYSYPSGGSYSGGGISGQSFDPSTAVLGSNLIKYSYTSTNGCSASDSIEVVVNSIPNVSITSSLSSSYCRNDASVSLTASPVGGSFSGSGISGNSFNPNTAYLGLNAIQYQYVDANGCSNSDTSFVSVYAQPTVNILSNFGTNFCEDAPAVSLTAQPNGGTFSGPGISGLSFTPSNANIGNNTISYVYTDANGCSNSDSSIWTVNALPIVNLSTQNAVCANASAFNISGATPSGGVFSGNGISASGTFYPSIVSVGKHQLTYTFTNASGCSDTAISSIRVKSVPTSTFSANATACIGSSSSINFTGNAGSSAVFTWDFDNANITSGSGVGPYQLSWPQSGLKQISLSVLDSSCTSTTSVQYTNVLSSYAQIIAVGNTTVCYGDSVTLFANIGLGNQFQWYDTSGILTGDTLSYISVGNSGSYYCEVTPANNCPAFSDTIAVNVKDEIISDFTMPSNACSNDMVSIIFSGVAPTTATYAWSFNGGTIASGSASGPYNIIWNNDSIRTVGLTVTDGNCSSDLTEKQIAILMTPAHITALGATSFCDGNSVTLSANAGPNSYEWFKDGVSTGDTLALYNAIQSGDYTVEITNKNTLCNALSDTVAITVHPTDFNIAFTANPNSFSLPPFNTSISNQTPNMNDYYWAWSFGDGQTSTNVNPSHQYLYDGTYSIEVIAQNINTACVDTLIKSNYISCNGGSANPCNLNNAIGHIGSNNICPSDSVKLYAKDHTAGVSYQWLKDGVLLSGQTDSIYYAKQTGLYQLMVADNSCSVFSQPFSLTQRTTITPVILSNGNIQPCSNDSMELYVNTSFSSYQWSNGATTPGIFINTSGSYLVSVTDNFGCQSTSLPKVVNASFAPAPEICIVGIDTATNQNRIIWERQNGSLLDSFRIYRESTTAGIYTLIGSKPFSSSGIFLDTNSNPAQQSYRYRITAIDSCGMETAPSMVHKTVHLTINAGLNQSWNLIWSTYEGFSFGSYRIYRGTDSSQMQLLTQIQSTLNSYTDLSPPAGKVYYQIELISPHPCYPDSIYSKAQTNYNTSRSNKANTAAAPNIGFDPSVDASMQLRLYPNPNSGKFTLELMDKHSRRLKLKIYNALGSEVYRSQLYSNGYSSKDIQLKHLPKGVYYLRISSDDGLVQNKKIIIQ